MAILNNTGIRAGASGAGAGGYQIEKSLRFDSGDSAYLNRTPSGAGNRKTWTWSGWVKRAELTSADANNYLFSVDDSSGHCSFYFSADKLRQNAYTTANGTFTTNAVFRDPSAWYHIVYAYDSTQSTTTDRMKVYVNGTAQTFSAYSAPTLNQDTPFCNAGAHYIGKISNATTYSNFYLAEVHFLDGTAADPSSFGETDSTTGQWVPIKYAGSYGTTGFYLKFDGTDLGEDSAGSNDWTANNLTQGLNTISSPNMPTWSTVDTGWTVTNSRNASTSPTGISGYQHVITGNLALDTTYHFFLSRDDYTTLGGWFLTDSASDAQDTVPNEYSSGNSIGHRAGNSTVGTYGTYATANSTSNATGQLSGFPTTQKTDFEIVINRTVDKVWMRVAGASTWQGGGDPSNTSSTATFLIPDGANMVFGYVSYDNTATTANITDSIGDPLDIDVSTDTPTTFDDGGNGTGNYCTLNPLGSDGALSQGNLTHEPGAGSYYATSTMGFTSGKWYGEFTLDTHAYPGIGVSYEAKPGAGWMATQAPYYFIYDNGSVLNNYPGGAEHFSSLPSTTFATGVWQIALDVDNGKCWIGYQDTWYSDQWATTGNPATGANPTFTLPSGKTWYFFLYSNGVKWTANFGQRAFAETKPSGFLAPNTYNITDPTIAKPTDHVNAVLYTGTGSSQTISGVGFQPDLTWTIRRNGANAHYLFNSVAGVSEVAYPTHDVAFDAFSDFAFTSDGFTADGTEGGFNANTNTFVAWNWLAASANVTDSSTGSITSTYRANTDAGFSIVKYTGNSTTGATISHGLNATPDFALFKSKTDAEHWNIYHKDMGNTHYLQFDATDKEDDDTAWNDTNPTTTVMTLGNKGAVNRNTAEIRAFLWSEVDGYSKFGSYEGNGNADGPFVYCGFRPAILWLKNIDDGGNWVFLDNKRIGYNEENYAVFIPVDQPEYSSAPDADILSNGFKLRTSLGWRNASAKTHIFAAWAESPFKYSNAR